MAAERAVLADMGVLADPFARGMLTPPWRAFVGVVEHWPYRTAPWSVTRTGLAARVLWFDAQVVQALDAGIEQVAVIGAGYDSRAWRLRREGVSFFEVDHGTTQQDKLRRVPGPGPTYVAADLSAQTAADALAAHGLDRSRPALFVLEGLTMYLGEDVVRTQLRALARAGVVGSRLAVDFSPPPDAGTARDRRRMLLQRISRAGSGETLRLLVDRPQAVELVAASGWNVTEETSLRDAARSLLMPDSGLPLDAVSEHKALIAAARS